MDVWLSFYLSCHKALLCLCSFFSFLIFLLTLSLSLSLVKIVCIWHTHRSAGNVCVYKIHSIGACTRSRYLPCGYSFLLFKFFLFLVSVLIVDLPLREMPGRWIRTRIDFGHCHAVDLHISRWFIFICCFGFWPTQTLIAYGPKRVWLCIVYYKTEEGETIGCCIALFCYDAVLCLRVYRHEHDT